MKQRCENCKTSDTPLWRKGPKGNNTLCNACGLHYARFGSQRNVTHDWSVAKPISKKIKKKTPKQKSLTSVYDAVPKQTIKTPSPYQVQMTDRVTCVACQKTRILPEKVKARTIHTPTWTCQQYPLQEFAHCFVPYDHWSISLNVDEDCGGEESPHTTKGAPYVPYDDVSGISIHEPASPDLSEYSDHENASINKEVWAPFRSYAFELAKSIKAADSGNSRDSTWTFGEQLFQVLTLQIAPNKQKWEPHQVLYDVDFINQVIEHFGKDSRNVGIVQSILNLLRQCMDPQYIHRPTMDQVIRDIQHW